MEVKHADRQADNELYIIIIVINNLKAWDNWFVLPLGFF
jgi:hypothetical protein